MKLLKINQKLLLTPFAFVLSAAGAAGCGTDTVPPGDPASDSMGGAGGAESGEDQKPVTDKQPDPASRDCEDPKQDTDEDGLSDCDEILIHGTSPILDDTDGDGLGDKREVLDFNPDANNYRFNPLIADVPKIRFEMTSLPVIRLDYTFLDATESSTEVSRSVESARAVTTSESETNSTIIEQTHEAGASLSVAYGTGGYNVEGSLSYNYSHSTTNETSVTFTKEQTRENREALSKSEGETLSKAFETPSGTVGTTVTIHNEGNLSFTIKNILLAAVSLDPFRFPSVKPIGTLELETSGGGFPAFSLGPKAKAENLYFVNKKLSVEPVKQLLRDSHGMNLQVAAYEVTDENGRSYTHDLTAIGVRDATVIIDYGAELPSERYLVATSGDAKTKSLSGTDALESVLRLPLEVKNGRLSSVRGVETNAKAQWVVLHASDDGLAVNTTKFAEDGGLDLDDLQLRASDILHLVFLEDEDGDGLRTREEFVYGSDPKKSDTDGDELDDKTEVVGWQITVVDSAAKESARDVRSDGRISDTDGDGLSDAEEYALGSDPRTSDTDGDRLSDAYDFAPTIYSDLEFGMMESAVDLQLPFANSSIALSWTKPSLPDDISTQVVLLRSLGMAGTLAALPPSSQELVVGETLACVDETPCFEVIYVGDGNEFTDNALVDGTQIHYQPLLRVNGEYLLSRSVLDEYLSIPTTKFELVWKGIFQLGCIDKFTWLDATLGIVSDSVCEIYTNVWVDGLPREIFPKKPAHQMEITAQTDRQLEDVNVPIEIPTIPGQCRNLELRVSESEKDDPLVTDGDINRGLFVELCFGTKVAGEWTMLVASSAGASYRDIDGTLQNDKLPQYDEGTELTSGSPMHTTYKDLISQTRVDWSMTMLP